MKIIQVAYKSDISGGEKVLFDLATGLKERAHNVIAVCPAPGQLPDELRKAGIRSEIIPFRKTYDLRAARKLSRFIMSEKIEVLHSHGMLTNLLSRIAGHWADVPVSVSTEHLTMELARGGRGPGILSRLRAAYYRMLDNYTSRYNKEVIAVSKAVKDDLVEQGMGEEKVIVIRNGISIPELDPERGRKIRTELGIAESTLLVGTVGRLSPQKDYPTFLRAAAEVLRTVPKTLFLIAGDGYLRPELEALSRKLGIGDSVVFLGYRKDVFDIVSAFDIFALSSLWEGLPLAILEAMALGKPVVATCVPGTAEAVVDGETGYLVPLKDTRALARKIVGLVRNREKARQMGEMGRKRVITHFSIKRMVDEHENLYRMLLGEGSRRL